MVMRRFLLVINASYIVSINNNDHQISVPVTSFKVREHLSFMHYALCVVDRKT